MRLSLFLQSSLPVPATRAFLRLLHQHLCAEQLGDPDVEIKDCGTVVCGLNWHALLDNGGALTLEGDHKALQCCFAAHFGWQDSGTRRSAELAPQALEHMESLRDQLLAPGPMYALNKWFEQPLETEVVNDDEPA